MIKLNLLSQSCTIVGKEINYYLQCRSKTFRKMVNICVASTIKVYSNRTKIQQLEKIKTQLLISHVKPHSGVSSSAISRWVKEATKLTGFTTNISKVIQADQPHPLMLI